MSACLWCDRADGTHSPACERATRAETRLREIALLPSDLDGVAPHVPGTDYYDGRDGSIESDEDEPRDEAMTLRGYPALWTSPADSKFSVEVQVIEAAGRGRITNEPLFNVRAPDGLIFTAARDTLLCLHDGEEDASDCLIGGRDG